MRGAWSLGRHESQVPIQPQLGKYYGASTPLQIAAARDE